MGDEDTRACGFEWDVTAVSLYRKRSRLFRAGRSWWNGLEMGVSDAAESVDEGGEDEEEEEGGEAGRERSYGLPEEF